MVLVQDCIAIPDRILEDAADIIGSKAAARSTILQLGLPATKAFVITSAAFYRFLHYQNGLNRWRLILDNAQPLSPENMVSISQQLQKMIRQHPIDPELIKIIHAHYHQSLGKNWAHLTISPTPTTKSPVNLPLPIIKGEAALIDFVRQLWGAQLSPHSLTLQLLGKHPLIQVSPILVSTHENALVSGTISTNKNILVLEAIYGTNPETDHKIIPADTYLIDRLTHQVISRRHQPQTQALYADYFGHYNLKKIAAHLQFAPKINPNQIEILITAAEKIHSHLLSPQKINYFIAKSGIYITRFKPVELDPAPTKISPPLSVNSTTASQVATGLIAAPGITTAPIIRPSSSQQSIIGRIAIITDPDTSLLPRLKQAAGIIIESGGISSHLSQIAREIGIPTLVGTGHLSLTDNTVVTLDAIRGKISINRASPVPLTSPTTTATKPLSKKRIVATQLLLSLNQINTHLDYIYQQAAGVGELRGNDLVLNMGIHPKRILDRHLKAFTTDFEQHLTRICHLFGDRPVYYHPIDLPTDVARKLEHGSTYEPIIESNSHLGFRGSFRSIIDPSIFKQELSLIEQLRHKHQLKNLNLCLPLIRSQNEFSKVKRLVSLAKLHRSPSFRLLAKIGTPAATEMIPKLATEGIDGLIIDLDLLSQLTLGFDPTSSEVDQELLPTHSAVINILKTLIDTADKHRIPHIISSYHLSQSADVVDTVIKAGASSLIIQAPQFDQVKTWILETETRLISGHKT